MKRVSRKSDAILVFSKGADEENVKTRLQPFLTSRQRFELHIAFLRDTIEKIQNLSIPGYLYVVGNSKFSFHCDLPIFQQVGTDLGSRLASAFDSTLQHHDKVVVVGTDSPDLPAEKIKAAFEKLHGADVVLGPTEDGGYYLLGLSRMLPEIFENISWGTSAVLQQTMQRVRNYKVNLLEPHYDVDLIADLLRLQKNLKENGGIAINTQHWFKRWADWIPALPDDMLRSAPE